MAGIITIAKGHDASYPWKQIGAAEPGKAATNRGKGVGYYLSPAEKGGEPPGIWTGKAGAELGLRPGGTVDRPVFERLYGQHLDPRDPSGETRLGRAPGHYKTVEAIHAAMLAAEPEATAERRAELLIEAKAHVRTPDLYWDATFSVSKSISLFHASALANADAAAQRGDLESVQAWEDVADTIWDAIMEGNAAALDYLQREAGQTRAGYHPGGRWEDARAWVIASFRQHTSRDGDPQLHVHNLILHKVQRESDGAWRALDSMSLYRHRPAASAIAALAAENALARKFGVQWIPRADGHGREIAGVDQALMDMFSSRRRSIGPLTARLAQAFEAQFGRAPDARALASLRQWANHSTRRGKDAEPLDLVALVRQWSAHARASEAGALEPVAPAVLGTSAPAAPSEPEHQDQQAQAHTAPLTEAQTQLLIQEAIAALQRAQPTWTEADLIRHLGELLPAHVGAMSAPDAAALLPALARQALATEAVALSAPEWPRVPDCLRRASGESLYTPHGATRYTTSAQLTLEDRLLAHAQEGGAPRLQPATAARLLGADQAHLEAQLRAQKSTQDLFLERVASGLRLDQATAAYAVLTSARRGEVMVGPAGSGKTRTITEMARVWRDAGMGEVIGLTTSQTARNVLADAGVTRAYNTAQFLGHLREHREARGPVPVTRGSLLVLDEASMMSLADMAAILALAHTHDCKVVIAGDHEQLAAVEGGGAMVLLARHLGYVQLAEPQRFSHAWEREATLRLRAGDITVLAEYEQHGRLRGGTAEEATEQAYRGWLADYLDGKDTLLLARTEEHARELSRRARDDLIRYGIVSAGPHVRLSGGEQASVGDLVMARRNNHVLQAGHQGRALANRDILQVAGITADGTRAQVRRLTHDPDTGQVRWSQPFQVPKRYLADHANLAYATTVHAAQGRTVDTAHLLVDGFGDRQGLYVAMSRGRNANHAYCVTDLSRAADTREGSRPAPELDRAQRLARERVGLPPGESSHDDQQIPVLDPVTVLAGILVRDGSELSATETLQYELSHADHLGVLGGIWDDVTRRIQDTQLRACTSGCLAHRPRKPGTERPSLHLAMALTPRGRSCRARRCPRPPASRRVTKHERRTRRRPCPGLQSPAHARRGATAAVPALDRTGAVDGFGRSRPLPMRTRRSDGRPHPPSGRAHSCDAAIVGAASPRPGTQRLRCSPRMGTAGQPCGRLPRTLRLRRPRRADRPSTSKDQSRSPGSLARGLQCAGARRWHRPPGLHRRRTMATPQHLRTRNRLGAAVRRRGTPPRSHRRTRRSRKRHPRRTRTPRRPRRPNRGSTPATRPDLARTASQSRNRSRHLRRRPRDPEPMGNSHRAHPPDRHRRRPRTTPTPPRPADPPAAPPPRRSRRHRQPC